MNPFIEFLAVTFEAIGCFLIAMAFIGLVIGLS